MVSENKTEDILQIPQEIACILPLTWIRQLADTLTDPKGKKSP